MPGARSQSATAVAATDPETEGVELVYSVNRTPEPPFDTARAVQVLTSGDIWRKNARTLPEALMEEAGIFVQQTNYGGGSPIIRGLVGKQVLILVDGVKLNNSTYRFGPIQYLSTIDLSMVERIEIVRGVGSVLGSDALGSTINIITRKGPPGMKAMPVGGGLFGRYSSADGAFTGHGEAFGRGPRYRYYASGTQRRSGDVDGGGVLGSQRWTGYDEEAGSLAFDFYVSDERTLSIGYQALQQDDVPRTDKMVDGTNLQFDFEPQRLQIARLGFQDLTHRRWNDLLQLTVYWNRQDEGRNEIRASKPNVLRDLSDAVIVLGTNLELGSSLWDSHRLIYGIDFSTEDVHSGRTDVNLTSGASTEKRGTYTDGASYSTLAAYAQDRFDLDRWLTTTLGARVSRFAAHGSELSSVGHLDLESRDAAVTGTVNLVFHAGRHVNLIANTTRGFRAPNIDDISVFDERKEGTEVPNRNLEPEGILTSLAGVKYSGAKLSGSAFYHWSRLTDLLVRAAGTFEGLPFFDLNGDGIQNESEPNVLQKHNIGRATVQGVELDARYRLRPGLTAFGNCTWTQGDDDLEQVPLAKIPPTFGALGLRWMASGAHRPWLELVSSMAAAQRRLSTSDLADSRIGPGGTPAFAVLHLRSGVAVTKSLALTFGLENVFDAKYKYHGSGVYRPGRQMVFGARVGR